jgi:uncharacterized protein (UPF0332 family)
LPDGFQLRAAQVVFEPDADAPLVRINEEVRALARVRPAKPFKAGDPVTADHVAEFLHLELTDENPNAGHITMVLLRDQWTITFNFRYNAHRVQRTLEVAREFLDAAKHSIDNSRLSAGVDTLYSAVELLARAWLLPMPIRTVLAGKTHGSIQGPFNIHGKLGNTDMEFVQLLNQLSELRPKARYLSAPLSVDQATLLKMLSKAQDMLCAVEAHAPRRELAEEVSSISPGDRPIEAGTDAEI